MESSTSFALDNFLKKARLCYDNLKFGKAYAFYLLVLKVSPAIRHNIKEEFTETWREWSEKLLHLNKIQELVTLYEQGCFMLYLFFSKLFWVQINQDRRTFKLIDPFLESSIPYRLPSCKINDSMLSIVNFSKQNMHWIHHNV